MKRWFIRHNPTGHYLPEPHGRAGRGGSFTEPKPDDNLARMFTSKMGAQRALSAWLKGKYYCNRGRGSYEDPYDCYEEIEIEPQPHRIKEDMEVIEVEIKLP